MTAKKSQKKKEKRQKKNYCCDVCLEKDAEMKWREISRKNWNVMRYLRSCESGPYGMAVQRYLWAVKKAGDKFFDDVLKEVVE